MEDFGCVPFEIEVDGQSRQFNPSEWELVGVADTTRKGCEKLFRCGDVFFLVVPSIRVRTQWPEVPSIVTAKFYEAIFSGDNVGDSLFVGKFLDFHQAGEWCVVNSVELPGDLQSHLVLAGDSEPSDLWESIVSAEDYVRSVYMLAEKLRDSLCSEIKNLRCQKPIEFRLVAINNSLGEFVRLCVPIESLIERASNEESVSTILSESASSFVRLLTTIQSLSSPSLTAVPFDLSVDWERDEPWKWFVSSAIVIPSTPKESLRIVAECYQKVFFSLSDENFPKILNKERERVIDLVPSFVAIAQMEKMRIGVLDHPMADGLSDDGLTLRWGGVNYPVSTTASGVIRLLVDSFNRGFPYLHETYLMTEAPCETQIRNLVRNNGLNGVVIREICPDGKIVKGKWGLINPEKKS